MCLFWNKKANQYHIRKNNQDMNQSMKLRDKSILFVRQFYQLYQWFRNNLMTSETGIHEPLGSAIQI